jgi:hypothetical protein
MIIFELVVDNYDTWYSLGLFQDAESAISIATARDGVDGKPVSEEGEHGERLFVRRRILGHFDPCGDVGIDVVEIVREPAYQESIDSYHGWTSKITRLPNPEDHRGASAPPVHLIVGQAFNTEQGEKS